MTRAYVLCTQRWSPIAITSPKVVAIYESLKAAKSELRKRVGSARTRNDYWIESAPYISKEQP